MVQIADDGPPVEERPGVLVVGNLSGDHVLGSALALEVVGSSQVLVVNGDQGDNPEESETFYLSKALDLGTEVITGIDVTEILPHSLLDYDLAHTNMIWLANVPALQPKEVEKLEQFARAGCDLLLFCHHAEVQVVRRGVIRGSVFVFGRHEERDVVLSRMVLVKRYFELAEDPNDPVAVPLRVKGSTGHPLMATKAFGSGQVTVFATTADMAYSDLCISPAYLVLCQELHKHTTRTHSIERYNQRTTGTLKLEIDPAEYRRDAFVRALGGQGFEGTFTAVDAEPGAGVEEGKIVSVLTLPMSELQGVGLFELTLAPHRGEPERRLISRSVPPDEGRLQRLGKAQWLRVDG